MLLNSTDCHIFRIIRTSLFSSFSRDLLLLCERKLSTRKPGTNDKQRHRSGLCFPRGILRMFGRSATRSSSDSWSVLDRESNAFSSRAIMLLLPGWRRADRRYIDAVGEERELSSSKRFFPGERAFFPTSRARDEISRLTKGALRSPGDRN